MEFRKPMKKGFKTPRFNAPLPICEENVSVSEYDWPLFTGKYNGTSVIVDESVDIVMLVNKGFFGKGSLSRGAPSACKRRPPVNVITESQWKRRKEWSEKLISSLNVNIPESSSVHQSTNKSPDNNIEKCDSEETTLAASVGNNNDLNSITNETIDLTDSPIAPNILDSEANEQEEFKNKDGEDKEREKNSQNVSMETCKPVEVQEPNPMDVSENSKISEESKNKESALEKSVLDVRQNSMGSVKSVKPFRSIDEDKGLQDDEVLVINDIDNNFEGSLDNLNPHIEKESVKTVIEVLYLSLEEAFFLSFALQCLQVIDLTSKCLSVMKMWNLFRTAQPDFVEKYVAYHHFRSKGWVVKSGLKYGGDFLLYKKGPLYFHASYVVVVKLLNPDGTKAKENSGLTWDKMLTLNRLCETASKDVLIFEVMKPDLPESMFQSPHILKEFKVGELLLRRWQPTQEKAHEIKTEF